MVKSYFYSVNLTFSEDREEKKIEEIFKNKDITISRSDAFSFFQKLFDKYEVNFLKTEHILPIELIISFNIGVRESESESGIEISSDHPQNIPLYIITFQKIEELGNNIINEIEKLKSLATTDLQDIYDFGKNIASSTGEIKVIDSIRRRLSQIDPNSYEDQKTNMQIIECSRCGKKIEVEKRITKLFIEKRNRGSKVSLSCTTCIKTYYSNPQFDFSLQEIYDKYGKSVIKRGRDIDYYER
jgi:hypothetical protein